jgi:tetratricopeptide (TPR) repeat protein
MNHTEYQNPRLREVAEALEEAYELRRDDPRTAEARARQALRDLDDVIRGDLATPESQDLRARGWIHVANSRRLCGDWSAAERYLDRAEDFLEKGSHRPEERAWLLSVRARLLADLRRLDESLALLDQVTAIQRWIDDPVKLVRHLISKSNVQSDRGLYDEALTSLEEAEALLEGRDEPWLRLAVLTGRIYVLIDLNRPAEAEPLVALLDRHEGHLGTIDRARLDWTRGLLHLNMGRFEEAVGSLQRSRRRFLEAGVKADAALISLDLAATYLAMGRTAETRRLADELLPLLQHLDISREAFAALILFHKAAQQDTLTTRFVADISSYLKRASSGPPLRFEKPS